MTSEISPQQILTNADCLHDEQEVQAAFERLATEITTQLENRDPLLFCVMNGGLVVTGQLLPRLRFPLQCEYVHVTRYGKKTLGGQLNWVVKPSASIAGRMILIIDDILDEGYTLAEIVRYCIAEGAAEVRIAVLVDKQHNRKAPGARADFVGLQVADRFLFGYGMDYHGYWRNAPGIYAVRSPID